jgi:hypothetical protein
MFPVEVTVSFTVPAKIFMRSLLQDCAALPPSSEGRVTKDERRELSIEGLKAIDILDDGVHCDSEKGWGRGPLPSLNDDGPNPDGFGPSSFLC